MKLSILKTLLPFVLLGPASANSAAPSLAFSIEYQFFPHSNCVGPALICRFDRLGQCCGKDVASASVRGNWSRYGNAFFDLSGKIRIQACSGSSCNSGSPCHDGPIGGKGVCFNTPYAVHSAKAELAAWRSMNADSEQQADQQPSLSPSDGTLEESLLSKQSEPKECAQPKWVAWIGEDGEQVEAEIPEGRYEEIYEAVEKNDLEKLDSLGGTRREAMTVY